MTEGDRFSGFPAGGRATAVPNLFFTTLLPKMEDPAELALTIYLFFAWQRQRGYPRYLTLAQLTGDATLRQALSHLPGGPEEALWHGLELALRRGSLLRATLAREKAQQEVYLLNNAAGRSALERLQRGEVTARQEEAAAESWEPALNIFSLYEENIGAISPLIAQELAEAESQYPAQWLEAAFREAVRLNKRSWRYIQAILERWAAEGPDYEKAGRDSEKDGGHRRPSGPYRDLIGH
ncbi:MAG: DnaD domain-containing protein [Dehalococcoidia bacterium]